VPKTVTALTVPRRLSGGAAPTTRAGTKAAQQSWKVGNAHRDAHAHKPRKREPKNILQGHAPIREQTFLSGYTDDAENGSRCFSAAPVQRALAPPHCRTRLTR